MARRLKLVPKEALLWPRNREKCLGPGCCFLATVVAGQASLPLKWWEDSSTLPSELDPREAWETLSLAADNNSNFFTKEKKKEKRQLLLFLLFGG